MSFWKLWDSNDIDNTYCWRGFNLWPFPYKDSHCVPWKYDVTLISTWTRKEEVCSNISSSLAWLTRSGRCYTPEELEKRKKEIGKSTTKPVRNRVITEETEELLKTIRKADYSVIQQLKKSSTQISILALLLSFEVLREALLKVLKEMHVPAGIIDSSFEGMVSLVLATNQVSFSDDKLPSEGRDHTLVMHIIFKCEDMIVARCKHCILYPLRLRPLFPNDAWTLRLKASLEPN